MLGRLAWVVRLCRLVWHRSLRVHSEASMAEKITKRADNYSQWYLDIVAARRPGRELRRARLHGHQAARLRHLGEDAAGPRPHVQGHRPRQRLFPAVHPQVVPGAGRGDGRGLRQGVRRRHALPAQGSPGQGLQVDPDGQARRRADHPADVGDDHLEHLQELDSELSRPAAAHQPVVQRRPLGDAHPALSAHGGVSLAGGPHRPRHAEGGRGGSRSHAGGVPHLRRGVDGDAGADRPQERRPEVPRARSTRSASRR